MTIEIVTLNADEAQAALPDLYELLKDSIESGASIGFLLPVDQAELEQYWQGVIADVTSGKRILMVARQEGRIIGSVQLELAQKANAVHRAEVQKLLVHRAARRQGIASKLMVAIEDVARKANRTLLVLDTRKGDPAEVLYLKLGYIASGVIPNYAISPEREKIDPTLMMYKVLS